jgi:predicted RND superfamily exporter protein
VHGKRISIPQRGFVQIAFPKLPADIFADPMFASFRSSHANVLTIAAAAIAFLLISVVPAEAQRWNQRVQVVQPVEQDGAAYALLDSLVAEFDGADASSVMLRRAPDDKTLRSVAEIREELLEDGLGLVSATHVYIQYEFAIIADDFVETIEELQFIYRPANAEVEDIPLFTVKTNNPHVSRVLMNEGLPHQENLNTVSTFATLLSFPQIARTDATIVRLNNQTLREGHAQRRDALAADLVSIVYEDGMPVRTRTLPAPQN